MRIADTPVSELIPHDPPMVLLDRVLSCDETALVAQIEIRPGLPFCESDGVPAWVGIEYMAQSVAAHAGVQARARGDSPSIGFLLGTRAYKSSVSVFPKGSKLQIMVEKLFTDSGLAAFSYRIEMDGTVATATINAYQPEEDVSLDDLRAGKISR